MADGEEAAEVLVALAVLAEEGHEAAAFDFQLGTHQRADAAALRGAVEARRSIHAAEIGDAEDLVAGFGGGVREILGKGGSAQEAERAAGVELDVFCSTALRLRRGPRSGHFAACT